MLESDCCLIDKKTLMKKLLLLFIILTVIIGCKEDVVEKPDRLIEKGKMINIMYDLAILEASKYQSSGNPDDYGNDNTEYIYKKYKVDSTQLTQSNIYYASNYIVYEEMYKEVGKRINQKKVIVDSILKIKKDKQKRLDSLKIVKDSLVKKDSILKIKRKKLDLKKSIDSTKIKKDSIFNWKDSLYFRNLKYLEYTDVGLKNRYSK